MVGSRNLFRRRRNIDADENDGPGATSGGDGGDGGGGGGVESPSASASENNVNNTNASASESERRNDDVEAGNRDASITPADSNVSGNDASNATPQASADDEEQELVVQIPSGHPNGSAGGAADPADGAPPPFVLPGIAWEPTEEATALRREAIRQEVRRVQRANFIHFLVLCLVPTILLLIVIAAILGEDGECGADDGAGGPVVCQREPRSFVNAYTSRCICDAVRAAAVLPKTSRGDG